MELWSEPSEVEAYPSLPLIYWKTHYWASGLWDQAKACSTSYRPTTNLRSLETKSELSRKQVSDHLFDPLRTNLDVLVSQHHPIIFSLEAAKSRNSSSHFSFSLVATDSRSFPPTATFNPLQILEDLLLATTTGWRRQRKIKFAANAMNPSSSKLRPICQFSVLTGMLWKHFTIFKGENSTSN